MRNWAPSCLLLIVACGGGGGGGEPEPCGPGGTCPAGYVCNPVDNLCYQSGTFHPDAGTPTQPDTSISLKPPALTNSDTVEIRFTSDVTGATFVCRLDGGPFEPCSSPFTATVGEGTHTFAVAAVSGSLQDETPETWTWEVDLTPPDTAITGGTSGNVNNSEATFSFTSTEDGSSFECKFDDGAFAACTSDQVFTGFAMGTHTFTVRAKDAAGNIDLSPPSQSWTVDQTSPQTTIGSGPDALTNQTDATFTFASDKPGSTFACRLDGGDPTGCTSPQTYPGLADGDHTFSVVATDASGNPDPSPATFDWTIDTVPPEITLDSGPAPGSTTGPSVTFTFSSTENGPPPLPVDPAVTFECQLDSGAVGACDSPRAYTNLPSGSRTFRVRGVDRAHNPSAFISRTWTVDASRPTVSVTSPADGGLTRGSGQITFSGSEAGMTFACTLDGTAVTPCASPVAFNFTTDATHVFVVTGSARGLTSDPVTISWRADGVNPAVTISSPAAGATTGPAVAVTFSSEPGATFECAVGSGAFADCTSPLALLLAGGPASVTIRATDTAGNVSTDATRSWTVDATGPTVNVSVSPLVNGKTRTDGQVTYSSPEGGVTFRCRTYLSTAPPPAFGACAPSPFALSGFTHGQSVKIDVEGRDGFDNPSIGTTTVTIDGQGPQITITAPSGRIGRTGTVTFTYDSTVDNTGTFTCTVLNPAGGTVATGACTTASGLAFTAAGSGTHTARVNGTDGLGNTSVSTQTFTVDADGPSTKIGQCAQIKPDEGITCQITVTGSDAKSVQCRVSGLTSFADCTGSDLKTVVVKEGAVGLNGVEVRALDDLGNVGNTDAASGIGVEYTIGHAVLMGHDYLAVNRDTTQLMVNAVKLSYVFQFGFGRRAQVLIWCSTPTCDSTEEKNVLDILTRVGIGAREIKTFFDPPTGSELAGALVGRDIFIVHDQNGQRGATLDDIGKGWTVPMIDNFAVRGGTLIVLDGMDIDGKAPSGTFQLLVGPGAIGNIRPLAEHTGDKFIYGDPDPALQVGVTDGYTGPRYSIVYLISDDRWRRTFFINVDQTIVMHRLF